MLPEDVGFLKVGVGVEEGLDVEEGDGTAGVVVLLGEVLMEAQGMPQCCASCLASASSWQGASWES